MKGGRTMNENMECPICGKKFDANDCYPYYIKDYFKKNGINIIKEKDDDDSSENKN